jgi:Transglycosylase SLT domain
MRVFLLKERYPMQLTSPPVLIGLVIGALLFFFIVSRGRSSSSYPLPKKRSGSGTIVLLILLALVGAFLFGRSGTGLPFSLSTLTNALASPQHALTTLQASISQHPSSSAYQSLPLPKTAYPHYVALAQKDAKAVGLVPAVFIRQINQESGFNPNLTGAAGEIGIAQFMPDTARSLGVNAQNPEAALSGAAHLMASYVQTFHGDYEQALAAYNAGAGTVQQAIAKDGANWKQDIPPSTQHYIAVILNEG